jgi:hypothetical protein
MAVVGTGPALASGTRNPSIHQSVSQSVSQSVRQISQSASAPSPCPLPVGGGTALEPRGSRCKKRGEGSVGERVGATWRRPTAEEEQQERRRRRRPTAWAALPRRQTAGAGPEAIRGAAASPRGPLRGDGRGPRTAGLGVFGTRGGPPTCCSSSGARTRAGRRRRRRERAG